MRLRDAFCLARSSLQSSFMRSLLTILGLAVGVGAVLTVLSLGDAGEDRVEEEIVKLGVDKVWIRPIQRRHRLEQSDSTHLQRITEAPACAAAYTAACIAANGRGAMVQIAGFDHSMTSVHAPVVLLGRNFTSGDFDHAASVCLIDEALAAALEIESPGVWVSTGYRRMRVVGIIKGMNMQSVAGGNGFMILPLSTFADTYGGDVGEITLAVQRGQNAQTVAQQALDALTADGFRADTLEKEIDAAREIVRIFIAVLLCVAIVCMITGGIGVMNVLLISVRERRAEIGLIKAIGGTSAQVALLFLLEAAGYAMLGGILGTVMGFLMIEGFGHLIGLQASLTISRVVPVLLGAGMIGLCFGVFPATQAARMGPVDALRGE